MKVSSKTATILLLGLLMVSTYVKSQQLWVPGGFTSTGVGTGSTTTPTNVGIGSLSGKIIPTKLHVYTENISSANPYDGITLTTKTNNEYMNNTAYGSMLLKTDYSYGYGPSVSLAIYNSSSAVPATNPTSWKTLATFDRSTATFNTPLYCASSITTPRLSSIGGPLAVSSGIECSNSIKAKSFVVNSPFATTASLGSIATAALDYPIAYVGFNANRDETQWTSSGDAANNGGSLIMGDISGNLRFYTIPNSGPNTQTMTDAVLKNNIKMILYANGNLCLGTTNPQGYKLSVNGSIIATSIDIVASVPSSDYVFASDYKLRSLDDVEAFVKENKHLPEVPSAKEFKDKGYNVGQMDDLLLRKVEELTLYMIDLKKENQELKKTVNELRQQAGK